MSKYIWFGNRRYMGWFKPYRASPEQSRSGYEQSTDYLSGGGAIDQSLDGHDEFSLVWSTDNPDTLAFVRDFRDGRYGRELMYWTDPMFAKRNACTPAFSMPWIAAEDAIPLVLERPPLKVDTPANSYRYPVYGAEYTVFGTDTVRTLMVPIPPGYTAHVGVHGNVAAEDMVKVTPYEGMVAGSPVNPVILGVATSALVNTSFDGTGQSWIELSLDLSSVPDGDSKTFELYAMVVQVLPTGTAPGSGEFVVGRGHSGVSFKGHPKPQPISSGLDKYAVSAQFKETGAWE